MNEVVTIPKASVSVVIPTYNRATLLRETLRSIFAQTVAPLEIIVVDDGSKDNTREECERLGPAIRYISQENKGLPAARNTGIVAARGEWVALCDSDDCWEPRKIELQLAATTAVGADWSVTGFRRIGPDGQNLTAINVGFEQTFPV